MNGAQTDALVAALEELRDSPLGVQDFDTLLFLVGYQMGIKNEPVTLDTWRQRLLDLVAREGMSEDLLVTALAHAVTEQLEHAISHHGAFILRHERMLQEGFELAEQMLQKLKSPGYLAQAQLDLDTWTAIVATRLGPSQRAAWERERTIESGGRLFKEVPEEIWNVFRGVPFGKLKRVNLDGLKNMTVEQAQELRRRIDEDD